MCPHASSGAEDGLLTKDLLYYWFLYLVINKFSTTNFICVGDVCDVCVRPNRFCWRIAISQVLSISTPRIGELHTSQYEQLSAAPAVG